MHDHDSNVGPALLVATATTALITAVIIAVTGTSTTKVGPTHRLRMDAATMKIPGSHVAIWLGVNDQLHNWIQGGIEIEYGNQHPYIYLETGHEGKQTYLLRMTTSFGMSSTFRLARNGKYWQIIINGKIYPIKQFVNHPRILRYIEMNPGTTALVNLDGSEQRRPPVV